MLGGLVSLAVVGGAWWWYTNRAESDVARLTLYGNVDIREVELAFEARGRIDRVEVEEGDRVTEGQVLASLEDERFRHELDAAEAREEAQRQVVAKLEAGTRPQNIRQARYEVKAAKARLDEAGKTRDRIAALVPDKAASQAQLDDAKAAYETAGAELRVARAALDLAEAGPREEDVHAGRARLTQLEAEAALAQWALDETELVSPVDGVVRERILEPGDMAAWERPVFQVALTDPLWVRAYVDEPNLGKLAPGMDAVVTTDSYPDAVYEGWIGFMSPTAEFTPKSVQTEQLRTKLVYEVRVFVHNPRGQLRLGMPATVTVDLDQDTIQKKEPSQETDTGPKHDGQTKAENIE
ncbi:MAG: efflux RND transporter periplasmic adaptor subunit [Planctomycetota bacterium]